MTLDDTDDEALVDASSDEDDSTNINNKIRVVPQCELHKSGTTGLAYNMRDGAFDPFVYAGSNGDGSISGTCRMAPGKETTFEDDQICSEICFWKVRIAV